MERRKAAQQYVRDDTSCPNVNLEAVSVREERKPGLDYGTSSANARHRGCHSSDSPRLSNDLWRHVSGRATHGVERPVNDGGQAEVPELQRSASILMFVHLRNNHNERN